MGDAKMDFSDGMTTSCQADSWQLTQLSWKEPWCHLKQHSTWSGAPMSDFLRNLLSEGCKCSTFTLWRVNLKRSSSASDRLQKHLKIIRVQSIVKRVLKGDFVVTWPPICVYLSSVNDKDLPCWFTVWPPPLLTSALRPGTNPKIKN